MNQNPNEEFGKNSYYSYTPSGAFSNVGPEEVHINLNDGKADRFGQISMILGIIALGAMMFFCMGFFFVGTLVLAIVSLVYASKSKKASPEKRFGGKALTGLICSIISLAMLVMILTVLVFYVFLVLIFV